MRELVIDTATEALSLALFEDGELVAHNHEILGRGHAEQLMPRIAAFPGGGQADRIWVDVGPGSFTGVRVGLAAARALAFGWNADMRAYSALSLVAAMAAKGGTVGPILVAMTGGHGELFWQRFSTQPVAPLTEPQSTPIDALAQIVEDGTIYGSGADALIAARGWGDAVALHPDASCARLIPDALISAEAMPLYGRGADARPAAATSASPATAPTGALPS